MSAEKAAETILRRSKTVREFCAAHQFSRATFYARRSEMPATVSFGTIVRITPESEAAWQRARERKARQMIQAAARKSATAGTRAAEGRAEAN